MTLVEQARRALAYAVPKPIGRTNSIAHSGMSSRLAAAWDSVVREAAAAGVTALIVR
jgi:hypothetical protein